MKPWANVWRTRDWRNQRQNGRNPSVFLPSSSSSPSVLLRVFSFPSLGSGFVDSIPFRRQCTWVFPVKQWRRTSRVNVLSHQNRKQATTPPDDDKSPTHSSLSSLPACWMMKRSKAHDVSSVCSPRLRKHSGAQRRKRREMAGFRIHTWGNRNYIVGFSSQSAKLEKLCV